MNKITTVYGLKSSGGGGIRYVGQTQRSLEQRLCSHLRGAKKRECRLERWIRSVLKTGNKIEIFTIEENAILHESEKKWIRHYRVCGVDLVNVTDGGEGNHGYKWTKEQIENISKVRKGRIITPEWRENIGKSSRGKPRPAWFGKKVSAGKLGIALSMEHRKKLSDAKKGRPDVIAHCRRIAIRREENRAKNRLADALL